MNARLRETRRSWNFLMASHCAIPRPPELRSDVSFPCLVSSRPAESVKEGRSVCESEWNRFELNNQIEKQLESCVPFMRCENHKYT